MNYLNDFLCERQIDEYFASWEDFEEEDDDLDDHDMDIVNDD